MGAIRHSLCWAATILTILPMTASASPVLRGSDYTSNKSLGMKVTQCIASADDLLQAYIRREHHNAVAAHQTIFNISQEDMLTYTQFAIYYRTLPPRPEGNIDATANNNTCCNPTTEKDCRVLITSRRSIFVYFPPQLVYTMVSIITFTPTYLRSKERYGLLRGCWTPPTFCDNAHPDAILRDFSFKLLAHHCKDLAKDVSIPAILLVPRTWFLSTYHPEISFWVHMLFASMCLISFPAILCMVQKMIRQKDRQQVLSGSPILQALYGAVCVSSWVLFVNLYFNSFQRLLFYKWYLEHSSNAIPEIFMSFVTVGQYVLLALGGIFFVEFLFMMWYISQKMLKTNAHFITRRRSCLPCCMKQAEALGLTGVVLFFQILAGNSIYFFTLVMASPLQAVATIYQFILVMVLITLLIALLIIPCTAACRRCPKGSGKLALSVLVTLMALIFYLLLTVNVTDNTTASFDAGRIAASLSSSILLALVGYLIKLLLFQKIPQERELLGQYNEIKD